LVFVLYKLVVRPFKRTPGRWVAIIFNPHGKFAVEQSPDGRRLPSGEIVPGRSIAHLCLVGLGLDQTQFSRMAPLQLIEVVGRGGEGFVFYYSGVLATEAAPVNNVGQRLSFLDACELGSFVPSQLIIS
jgi:hypothetical protein